MFHQVSTIYGSNVPTTSGYSPGTDQEGGLSVSNPVSVSSPAVATESSMSQANNGAAVSYNKEADQANTSDMMIAGDIIGTGAGVNPDAGVGSGKRGVTENGFDVFVAGDELRY